MFFFSKDFWRALTHFLKTLFAWDHYACSFQLESLLVIGTCSSSGSAKEPQPAQRLELVLVSPCCGPFFITDKTGSAPQNLPKTLFLTPIHILTSRIRTAYYIKKARVWFTEMPMAWLHFCEQQRSVQIEFYCHSSTHSVKVGQW